LSSRPVGDYPKILRINLKDETYSTGDLAQELLPYGGRGLIAKLMIDEVDPACEALGPNNKLILTVGPLSATGVSSAGRLSIGTKSPLTGGIKEANAGGTAATSLARLGYRAVVFEGAPSLRSEGKAYDIPGNDLRLVILEANGTVRFVSAEEYRGLGNYGLADRLTAQFGGDYSYIAIGPAGESLLLASGIAVSDTKARLNRFSARGGVGAVMGSRGIKAILVSKRGKARPYLKDRDEFIRRVREFNATVRGNPRSKALKDFGTASTVAFANKICGLPTRNFTSGQFDAADMINGEALRELILSRGGDGVVGEACAPGCLIECSNIFPDKNGNEVVGPLEYENICLLGSNLGIGNLDDIARLNRLCNDLGLDTIETGCALGVMAEAGVVKFGDTDGFAKILEEIPAGTLLGRLAGHGVCMAGKVLGVRRIPAVKGQGLSGYDPRTVKGTGVTFATSPMGADHTAGLTIFAPIDHGEKPGQVEASLNSQYTRAAYDTLGLCVFLQSSVGSRPDMIVGLLNAALGETYDSGFINELGKEVILDEIRFNEEAGITAAQNRLPEFFYTEPLPPTGKVFGFGCEELENIYGR
jgi:aldehyde:ferredoxin oxidoreductase